MAIETSRNKAKVLSKYNWVSVSYCLGQELVSTPDGFP